MGSKYPDGMKTSSRTFSLLAGLLLGAAASAQAATVSYSGSHTGPTDVTNQLVQVQQFDSGLGTLQSATFTLSGLMNTSAYATNDGDFYVGWDKLTYTLSLSGAGAYASMAVSANGAPVRVVGTGAADGTFTPLGEYVNIVGQPNWVQAGPTLSVLQTFAAGPLAAFIGTGLVDFFLTTLNVDTLSVLGSGSPSSQGFSTNVSGTVGVVYEYAPVPLPAALWLLGAGLLGVAGFTRRASA